MAATNKVLISVAVAALAAFFGYGFLRIKKLSLDNREMPVKHLKCQYLNNIEYGAEDITILKDGRAFISSGLKFLDLPSFSDEPGKMYLLDLLHPKPTPVELRIKGELDLLSFNPHGISVYQDEADQTLYLFVVNHPHHNSQVEIFRLDDDDDVLTHLKTITHPLLYSVNDVVAVGAEHFYATNDHFFNNQLLQLLVVVLGLPWCNVVYYSPEEVRVAADGIVSGNGINISPDKRYIYVSDIMDHEVDVFKRQDGEQLVKIKSVVVGSLCDNIEVDQKTGDLWLGCHPNAGKLRNFDPKDPPGSEVLRVENILHNQPVVTLEYGDDGHKLMGSTVAAPYEGKLLIGTIFHKALLCDLK